MNKVMSFKLLQVILVSNTYHQSMIIIKHTFQNTNSDLKKFYVFTGILHLGNILFSTVGGGETAEVNSDDRKS